MNESLTVLRDRNEQGRFHDANVSMIRAPPSSEGGRRGFGVTS